MASSNTPVPSAPKLKLPLQHYFQPKIHPMAQARTASPKTDTKPSPEHELREIYEWALTLDGAQEADVRKKPYNDRLALLKGPLVDMICDNEVVGSMPLRLLVATSVVARNAFIKNNGSMMNQFGVSQPGVAFALQHLVEYLINVMKVHRYHYSLPCTTCAEDIDLLLVADTLGWFQYVRNLHNYWWAKFKSEPVSAIGFENASALDARIMTYTDHFTILNLFVDRFARDPKYKEWRSELPNIEAAVQRLEAKRAEHQKQINEQRRQEKKEWKGTVTKQQFEENLRAARGGRPGGYGMGI
ncbi:hypothetical protein P171DRAFT_480891 [Karstenula rhodostoma CBS 690.94]|uniref:Uncharacterized protein n=1 Tax=Karstenula rhodostoma CBS 690.94 TaxID=1392251 RepID=A0A9P4PTD4_9PLEO|nr:hypothetical protein P171DRAFT_480891 [Karstenula rhodostoma CBS 690.94]